MAAECTRQRIRNSRSRGRGTRRLMARASSSSSPRSYTIGVLPGDGIGPEITSVAVAVLEGVAASSAGQLELHFEEGLIGGAAIDALGAPLPDSTLEMCRSKDAVLLAAIGGYKWDTLPSASRPERGLLALRAGLKCFANLRPAVVLPQLAGASTLKEEVVSGVDLMVVRELTGGIYFGEPRVRCGYPSVFSFFSEQSRTHKHTHTYVLIVCPRLCDERRQLVER